MTRLTASPAASQALERKHEKARLASRLAAISGRASALPQLNLGGLLAGAENKLNLLMFDECAKTLDDVDDRIERHLERLREIDEQARAATLDQHLAEHQGIQTFKAGSVRSRDGWVWLKSRNPQRLTPDQMTAGDLYGTLYRSAHRDMLRVSGANDNGDGTGPHMVDLLSAANKDLRHLQDHIVRATGSGALVALLDAVCGRGETIRDRCDGDKLRAAQQEAELRVALDMVSVAMPSLPSQVAKREERGPREPTPRAPTWFRGSEFG